MALLWKDKIDGVDRIKAADINAMANAIINLENNAEMSGDGGSAFKRIGFTDDCDYVATASDGRTAFVNALADAKENDVIIIMPGVYTSATSLSITKDITFVGISLPVIKFNVYTSGGGSFSYENWSWDYIYEPKHSKWHGFIFDGTFTIGGDANPDGEYHHGYTTVVDCIFNKHTALHGGDCVRCVFNNSLYSGHYFGAGCNYTCCTFNDQISFESGADKLLICEFHPKNNYIGYLSTGWDTNNPIMNGCKIYAPNMELSTSDPHSSSIDLNDTIVFAVSFKDDYNNTVIGGYIVNYKTVS